MPSEGLEFAIPAIKRLQTYALARKATAIGSSSSNKNINNNDNKQAEPKMCALGK
jgi:hypothetical protein